MKKDKNIKKKKKGIFKKIIIVFCMLIAILSGIFFGVCKAKYDGNAKSMILDIATLFVDEAKPIYVLVIGISEDINVELADTIMLCGYNPQDQDAFILSIPRDTFVGNNKNKAKSSDKINSYYKKGIDNIKQEVEEISGLEINNYVVVKTSMLVKIVDLIGGVNFDVPIDMDYDDPSQNLHIHLEKGYQKIDGEKAEQLLRFRHNNNNTTYPESYGNNDLGRMRTQREFIKATAEQTINIKNIFKVISLVEAVFDNLDTNLEKDKIMSYIPHALDMDVNNIKMEQLPGESKVYNGIWFYIHDKNETEILITNLTESFQTKQ
ncbi:MAG: LCP family protein [Candidatus Scatovivens sp.]